MKKKDLCIYAHYKSLTSDLKTHKPKMMAWIKALHANRKAKRDGVAMFIWDKIDFNRKTVMRDKNSLHNDQGIHPRRYDNYK